MSASSLHRESTDSMIAMQLQIRLVLVVLFTFALSLASCAHEIYHFKNALNTEADHGCFITLKLRTFTSTYRARNE